MISKKVRRRLTPIIGRGARRMRNYAVPEYRAKDYDRLFDIVQDRKAVPATYNLWREFADQRNKSLTRAGWLVVPVIVDPEALLLWCASHGLQPEGEAIERFVAERAYPNGFPV